MKKNFFKDTSAYLTIGIILLIIALICHIPYFLFPNTYTLTLGILLTATSFAYIFTPPKNPRI